MLKCFSHFSKERVQVQSNLEGSDNMIQEKSYEGEGARLHESPVYKTARTDIFIAEKTTYEVRAGSVKLKLVQGYELGTAIKGFESQTRIIH